MKKIIIATHNELAKGFKKTLNYIIPNTVEIIDINAYLENVSVDEQIDKCLENFDKKEQIFVFTDLQSGSVNQAFIKRINEYNIELITGVNLPILMAIVMQLGDEDITVDQIREGIKDASNELIYVNDKLKNTLNFEDDDE